MALEILTGAKSGVPSTVAVTVKRGGSGRRWATCCTVSVSVTHVLILQLPPLPLMSCVPGVR